MRRGRNPGTRGASTLREPTPPLHCRKKKERKEGKKNKERENLPSFFPFEKPYAVLCVVPFLPPFPHGRYLTLFSDKYRNAKEKVGKKGKKEKKKSKLISTPTPLLTSLALNPDKSHTHCPFNQSKPVVSPTTITVANRKPKGSSFPEQVITAIWSSVVVSIVRRRARSRLGSKSKSNRTDCDGGERRES